MSKINKIDEEVIVLDFLIRNQTNEEYAFDIDEIRRGTNIETLKHKNIIKIKDVDCRIVNKKIYYYYKTFKVQVQEVIDELVKDGKLKSATVNGVIKYSAI